MFCLKFIYKYFIHFTYCFITSYSTFLPLARQVFISLNVFAILLAGRIFLRVATAPVIQLNCRSSEGRSHTTATILRVPLCHDEGVSNHFRRRYLHLSASVSRCRFACFTNTVLLRMNSTLLTSLAGISLWNRRLTIAAASFYCKIHRDPSFF